MRLTWGAVLAAVLLVAVAPGGARAEGVTTERVAAEGVAAGLEEFWSPNLAPAPAGAPAPLATRAPNAVVIDAATGVVLGVKASERAIPPASMTKMMTALLVFEALERGEIDLEDTVEVSMRAARAPGSSMGLRPGDRPTIDALLSGLIVASGNDAAIALAQALAGSEAAFARRMTERAEALGLASARFRNATGLPAEGHRISVADLATLSRVLIEAHPQRFGYFGAREMRYAGARLPNRNPALFFDLSDLDARADGLKTGRTREAGFCVAASAVIRTADGPRRVIVVVAGLRSERARADETERLLRWAIARVRAEG